VSDRGESVFGETASTAGADLPASEFSPTYPSNAWNPRDGLSTGREGGLPAHSKLRVQLLHLVRHAAARRVSLRARPSSLPLGGSRAGSRA
jgi:hypothetical protein